MKLDVNTRPDPVFNTNVPQQSVTSRMVVAALPYLMMWSGKSAAPLFGALALYRICQSPKDGLHLGASAVLIVWKPKWAGLLGAASSLANDGSSLEKDRTVPAFWRFSRSLTFALSLILKDRRLVLASIAMQGATEGGEGLSELWRGRWIEGVSKLGLAGIRTRSLLPELREYLREPLTQEALDEILAPPTDQELAVVEEEPEVNLAVELKKGGYRLRIENLTFHGEAVKFKGVHIIECEFDGDMQHSSFIDSAITASQLSRTNFSHSTFRNLVIRDSDLSESLFKHSIWENVQVIDCDMIDADLEKATLNHITIEATSLFAAIFFDARVTQSVMKGCDLENVLLMNAKDDFSFVDCTEHKMTMPVVAFPFDHIYAGWNTRQQHSIFTDQDLIVYTFDSNPEGIDGDTLNAEVFPLLAEAKEAGVDNIPKWMFKHAPEGGLVARIRREAARRMEHVHGLFIPGGGDIEPEFYGAERQPETQTSPDTRQTVIQLAHLLKAPLAWGICRGHQLINVEAGGTLKQHVEGQYNTYDVRLEPGLDPAVRETAARIIGPGISGTFIHHQGVESLGEGLEAASLLRKETGEELPVMILSRDGTRIGTQFHPENHYPPDHRRQSPAQRRNANLFHHFFSRLRQQLLQRTTALRAPGRAAT